MNNYLVKKLIYHRGKEYRAGDIVELPPQKAAYHGNSVELVVEVKDEVEVEVEE